MSVCRKLPDGTIQKIAGHTILLDANASEVRQGRWDLVSAGVGWVEQNIIFTDPMPDNDYIVVIESDAQTWAAQPGPYRITNKTTTGFTLASFNDTNATGQVNMNIAGTYTAFKPVKIEGYTALQNKVNNPDDTPTIDSMNLVTSDGVARAIENASAVWKGTRAEWNALPAADKVKYDLAVLLDQTLVKAVDRETGDENNVADLTKVFTGTDAAWSALTTAEKTSYALSATSDRDRLHSVDRDTGDVTEVADLSRIWRGTKEEWDELTEAERDKWDQAEIVAAPANVDLDFNYSTDETLTGATWIDGKPVYRKVIQSALPVVDVDGTPVTLSIPHGVSNIGHIISITGTVVGQDSGEEYYGIGFNVAWPVGDTRHCVYVQRAGDHLNIVSTRTVMNDWNIFIILEYTKTTDV